MGRLSLVDFRSKQDLDDDESGQRFGFGGWGPFYPTGSQVRNEIIRVDVTFETRGKNREIRMEKVNQTFFLSHGSPTLSIDDTLEARQFFKSWSDKVFLQKPKSILVISAHWDTKFPSVNTVLRNSTIHDFYGFPDPMYKLKYEAPGAIELGKRVKELLMGEGGLKRVDEDNKRGLDHGAWVPLMLMYPEADIPICQLSVQSSQSGSYHYNMGKALAPLKDEGVLIIGSGSATHNLRKLDFNITNGSAVPWALSFDHWLRDSLLQGRYGDVNEWEEKAPNAKMAHPWPEHLYPLHVAMGAAGEDAKAEQIHTSWQLGTLSYSSYSFTSSL